MELDSKRREFDRTLDVRVGLRRLRLGDLGGSFGPLPASGKTEGEKSREGRGSEPPSTVVRPPE
jgi:hypothetical protein